MAAGVALALAFGAAAPALATTFLDRPIKLVVPYSPGGIADSLVRRLAESMRHDLQQPVIVENKPGANTAIGAIAVTTRARVGALPQVPTVAEGGLPNYNVSTWCGPVGPADEVQEHPHRVGHS